MTMTVGHGLSCHSLIISDEAKPFIRSTTSIFPSDWKRRISYMTGYDDNLTHRRFPMSRSFSSEETLERDTTSVGQLEAVVQSDLTGIISGSLVFPKFIIHPLPLVHP